MVAFRVARWAKRWPPPPVVASHAGAQTAGNSPYLALDGAMMSVDTRDPANPGAPRMLFDSRIWVSPVEDQYDVTADGQRFLVIVPEGQQASRLTVLTNWPSLLAGR